MPLAQHRSEPNSSALHQMKIEPESASMHMSRNTEQSHGPSLLGQCYTDVANISTLALPAPVKLVRA